MNGNDRQFFVVLLIALAVALAGCTGGGSATPTDAEADGVGDGGNGGDAGGPDESSGDATPTDTGMDETATQAGPSTVTATATPTPTPNAADPAPTDEAVGPLLEDLIRSAAEFRYRVETQTAEGTYVQVGRWHGDDYYASIESINGMDQSYEVYSVDGQVDTVIGGQCIDMDTQQVQNPRNTSQADIDMSQRPTGTDTIDGEAVYVYEIQTGERLGTVTYYVDTESGYVRKMELLETTYEYSDFGSVEPVESPC